MTSWHAHPGFGHEVAKHGVAKPDDCREIGEGVCIRPLWHWRSDLGETEADARIMGYAIAHEVPGQEARCEGVLALKEGFGPPVWTQEGTLEGGDLTLRPSIQCKTHAEFHAFVTNGRWTG